MSTEKSIVARSYKLSEVATALEDAGHRITTRALQHDIQAGRLNAFRKAGGGIWYVGQPEFDRVMADRGRRPARANPNKPRKAFDVDKSYMKLLKHRYGLTPERYSELFEEQKGRCAICRCDPSVKYANQKPNVRRLHVDHWHDDTTAVRGLLCHNCNFGVGRWLDNPQLLKSAVRYLDKHIPLRIEEAS